MVFCRPIENPIEEPRQLCFSLIRRATDYVAVVKDGKPNVKKVQLKEHIYENDDFGELLDRDVAT